MILLNPGPVNLSEGVRHALTRPDLCHREPEFGKLQQSIRDRLLDVYDLPAKDWAAVLLTGSGTAGIEAMMSSLIPRHGKVLVIENGVYGERLAAIAETHRIGLKRLSYEWGEPYDITDVEDVLNTEDGFTHVALVHHETTTGLLNDVSAIGRLCQLHGLGLLVDAVSSFGAEELDFDNWGIAACAGAANKCLHGAPGVAFVIVNRRLLQPRHDAARRTLYLDLANYCREQDAGSTPFTQSVQLFYALAQALEEFAAQGGWRARHECYRRLARRLRQGLVALDIEPMLSEALSSTVLSAFYLPNGMSYSDLHDGLKARGFVIYAGQARLAQDIFRVSVMGAVTEADIERLLASLEEMLGTYPMERERIS